jgi:pSer/pThr/pTyr-binding forkhead associated (FHA) protein
VTAGEDSGRLLRLGAGVTDIGRGDPEERAAGRMNLAEPTVSRVQVTVRWDAAMDAHVLQHNPSATNATQVNGETVTQSSLRVGDEVRAGRLAMVVEAESHDETGVVLLSSTDEPTGVWGLAVSFELFVERGNPRDLGQVFPLTKHVMMENRVLLIGSPGERQNDIALYDADNAQARLEFRGGRFWIFEEQPVIVNGLQIAGGRPLRSGDRMAFGGTTLVFREAARKSRFWMEMPGRRVRLNQDMRVGRSVPCEIVLSDPNVSRHHATLLLRADGCFVRHQSATNPTLVNGVKVVGERRLQHGDEIRLSERSALVFVDADADVLGG